MIEIISIRSCDSGDGIRIVAECGGVKNTYTVSADDYLESGIVKGIASIEISEWLQNADSLYSARRAALRILASAQCSAQKLYEKLCHRGFPHECAKNAAEFAKEKGYINEDWQIENYLKTLVEKKYTGRRKVLPMLLAKGYSGDRILSLLDEMYTDEDFKKFRMEFLLKQFGKTKPDSFEEAQEMKKALYKRGY